MATVTTPAQIRVAVADLGTQEPAWRERYQNGARLLARGGWQPIARTAGMVLRRCPA